MDLKATASIALSTILRYGQDRQTLLRDMGAYGTVYVLPVLLSRTVSESSGVPLVGCPIVNFSISTRLFVRV